MVPAIEKLIEQHTAGSPVDQDIRWTNCSANQLTEQLQDQGYQICPDTLRRILFDELELSRRQAFKVESACSFPQRDEQFQFIARQRKLFEQQGCPVLSIDTKKKEILGDFFHPGRAYTDGRVRVQDHDFVTANQRLTPYGVFDTVRNEGLMYLATGPDTSLLACDAIWTWWEEVGSRHYQHAPKLLLLCDCGGSNGYRLHRFKEDLCNLADAMVCDIQVAHYPPGCSKYNPIEHRMFCHVTRALQAVVLKTIHVARDFIARTTTAMGLRVLAQIARHTYETGRKATDEFLDNSPIRYNTFLPQLNYTAPGFE